VARLVGVCAVLLVLVLAVVPAMGAVTSQSSTALTVTVDVPDKIKTNGFNYVTITFKNTASYPVSARVVVKPSYFALKPEWFEGVDAIKDGTGVTFTLFDIPAGGEKTVKVVIPGEVLENVPKGQKIKLFSAIVVYPFTSTTATTEGVEAKNFNVLSVPVEQSFINYDSPLEAFFPILLVFLGIVVAFAGAKYLD